VLLLILILSVVTFSSCKLATNKNDVINLLRNDKVSIFDFFSEVSVVPLQTPSDVILAEIIQVEYFNSHYYALDAKSQKIFCFDEFGNYVFHIEAQGKGPGEYNYITHFSIDPGNMLLILMDPAVQRVHFFDLQGNHVLSHTFQLDKVMGLSQAYLLTDSLLFVTSITHEHINFYCLKSGTVVYAGYDYSKWVPSTVGPFSNSKVYRHNNRLYTLLPLSQEIVDITDGKLIPVYHWDFGKFNNSANQWTNLLDELSGEKANMRYLFEAVGRGKSLHHAIWDVSENKKFRLAILEFDNNWKHVITEKESGQKYVFNEFSEGVNFIPSATFFHSDRIVSIEIPGLENLRKSLPHEISRRNFAFYKTDFFAPEQRQIIQNHDPMTDNPYLVVYKFKE